MLFHLPLFMKSFTFGSFRPTFFFTCKTSLTSKIWLRVICLTFLSTTNPVHITLLSCYPCSSHITLLIVFTSYHIVIRVPLISHCYSCSSHITLLFGSPYITLLIVHTSSCFNFSSNFSLWSKSCKCQQHVQLSM